MFAVCTMLLASIASGPISPQRDQHPANQIVQTELPSQDMLMPILIGYFDFTLSGDVPEYAERVVQLVSDEFRSDIEHPPSVKSSWLVTNNINRRAKTSTGCLAKKNQMLPYPNAIHRIDRTRFVNISQA